ncbi:hypothetical protein JW906_01835 [bacterium]|nr:hypothetical protein [bacterium]
MSILGEKGLLSFGVTDPAAASAFFRNIGFHSVGEAGFAERLNPAGSAFHAACREVSERIQNSSPMQIDNSPPVAAGRFNSPEEASQDEDSPAQDAGSLNLFDGSSVLQCSRSDVPGVELVYFSSRIRETCDHLQKQGLRPGCGGDIRFQASGGMGVRIRPRDCEPSVIPMGLTLHQLPVDGVLNTAYYPNPFCGILVAFICPVEDLQESISCWEKIGFLLLETHRGPYPHAVLSDGIHSIGLHETGDINGCGLLYAAPDMKMRLARLEAKAGLDIRACTQAGRRTYDASIMGPEGIWIYLTGF